MAIDREGNLSIRHAEKYPNSPELGYYIISR
jgi:hypothetical protein